MTTPTGLMSAKWRGRQLTRVGALLTGALLISALAGWTKRVGAVAAEAGRLDDARGEAALMRIQLERANTVLRYSTKYQIPADLASAVYDIALAEGIDPAIGFRLVRVESSFKSNARSSADAIGYTQIQLPTARLYVPDISEAQLYKRDTNLRLGFRFLKHLMGVFGEDLHLALLAYNRGPTRVRQILAQGGDPANGYAEAVLRGYQPPRSGGLSE